MTLLLKALHSFSAIPITIPMSFLPEIEDSPKVYIETQKTLNSKRSNAEGINQYQTSNYPTEP
jgi:hypothetical protein